MTETDNTLLMRAAQWQMRRREASGRGAWPKRAVALGVAVVATATTGVSFAAWSANGAGTAAAKAGTASGVTGLTASTTTSGTLYPGVNVPLVVNIHNPNSFPVTVTGVSVSAGAPTGIGLPGTCTNANSGVTIAAVNATGLSVVVPANGDNTYTTPTSVVGMASTSDNGCQGATFSWAATVTASS